MAGTIAASAGAVPEQTVSLMQSVCAGINDNYVPVNSPECEYHHDPYASGNEIAKILPTAEHCHDSTQYGEGKSRNFLLYRNQVRNFANVVDKKMIGLTAELENLLPNTRLAEKFSHVITELNQINQVFLMWQMVEKYNGYMKRRVIPVTAAARSMGLIHEELVYKDQTTLAKLEMSLWQTKQQPVERAVVILKFDEQSYVCDPYNNIFLTEQEMSASDGDRYEFYREILAKDEHSLDSYDTEVILLYQGNFSELYRKLELVFEEHDFSQETRNNIKKIFDQYNLFVSRAINQDAVYQKAIAELNVYENFYADTEQSEMDEYFELLASSVVPEAAFEEWLITKSHERERWIIKKLEHHNPFYGYYKTAVDLWGGSRKVNELNDDNQATVSESNKNDGSVLKPEL